MDVRDHVDDEAPAAPPAPAPAASSDILSKLTAAYVTIREQRAKLKREYEDADLIKVAEMEKIEAALLGYMERIGVEQLKPRKDGPVVYITTESRATCGDFAALYEHIKETGSFDLLERRVAQKAAAEYAEQHDGAGPPGIIFHRKRKISIRKS